VRSCGRRRRLADPPAAWQTEHEDFDAVVNQALTEAH
jgi:hypothetical protein